MSLESRLSRARLNLLFDFPFFGQLALRLVPVINPAVETAQTDGKEIHFSPDFCEKLSDKQLTWLYAHEVAHPALGHLWRMGARDPERINQAADYVVNEMLESVMAAPGASSRMERIPSALLDPQFYGMSMEDIYQLLGNTGGNNSGNNSGSNPSSKPKPKPLGTFTKPAANPTTPPPSPGQTPPPTPSLEQEWKSAAAQAATVARMRGKGNLPGAIEQLLRELFEPAIAWQDVLRQFVSRICRDDYTFRRPNRRFAHMGIMLPTLRSEGIGRILIAVDTSGSIDIPMLTSFLTELQSILDTCSPEVMHVLDCDAVVRSHREFRTGDDLRSTKFRGGGGTRFEPVFEFAADRDLQPDCCIYFTDLMGSFPRQEPPFPTLWLNYGYPNCQAPFGQTIFVPKA